MSDSLHELDAWIARVRKLPELVRAAAPDVARVVERELQKQIARASSPDGKAWQRNADGTTPLRTADKALAVAAVGTRVFARLRGHVARHHKGIARGAIVRRILPRAGEIPDALAQAIADKLAEKFREAVSHG